MIATPPLLVKPAEAARILGVGKTKVFELLKTGGPLDSVLIGPRLRMVTMESIQRLVDAARGSEIVPRESEIVPRESEIVHGKPSKPSKPAPAKPASAKPATGRFTRAPPP